jgi:hypothetical protein
MNQGVEAKPHLRLKSGYWRVSAVPVKWNRLSLGSQRRFKKAHDFATRKNANGPVQLKP